ncbi:hypothetical protein NP493_1324g00023 [Ridgeia piscesae]|uniref:Uncharacterized protein n=1 Tax=Ridgeia piscesae TaxID=27915 RepID=A0AAD9K7Y5_RIDPI|nr:hypothetical protein NP493_1324g00023 [Ridgeia piscesae]
MLGDGLVEERVLPLYMLWWRLLLGRFPGDLRGLIVTGGGVGRGVVVISLFLLLPPVLATHLRAHAGVTCRHARGWLHGQGRLRLPPLLPPAAPLRWGSNLGLWGVSKRGAEGDWELSDGETIAVSG